MSYQILPNIIFLVAVVGIILIILRRLPEVGKQETENKPNEAINSLLSSKGLPAITISKTRTLFKIWVKKSWNFVLEAKDLKQTNAAGYKFKKIFQIKDPKPVLRTEVTLQSIPIVQPTKDEAYYFDLIKKEPKNLSHYDALGKYYLEKNIFSDSKDIYLYLVNHEPTNPEYFGRLAYSCYKLAEYSLAAENYIKSLGLDSIHPNRYYNLGICYQHLEKYQEAVEAFKKAVELDPENSKFAQTLSKVYLKIQGIADPKSLTDQSSNDNSDLAS